MGICHVDREVIATNGNRYDVNLVQRKRTPVYWDDQPNEVRRSKWFYLPEEESRYIPYDEQMNELLEVCRRTKKIHFIISLRIESLRRNLSKTILA